MDLNAIPARSERELYIKNSCVGLLNKYGNEPTEHAIQLAIFLANEMEDDYEPKKFHESEPEVMRDYKALADDRARMTWDKEFPEWRKRDDVSSYLDKKGWVKRDNESSVSFLEGCVDALEGTEFVLQKQKLLNMVAKYPQAKVAVATVDWHN
jgi:hypothetical protein